MVFSSNLFLFLFLPAVLTLNYLLPGRLRNAFLFLASTFFYLWGAGPVVVPFLLGIAFNYYAGELIVRTTGRRAKVVLAVTLGANLGMLVYYKYTNFFAEQVRWLLHQAGHEWTPPLKVVLPIGISFFVFQAMTYPIELYQRKEKPAKSLIDLGAYLALFAHLIAGPVVRYSDISRELAHRHIALDRVFYGLRRFSVGLAKKVLIANQMGLVADQMFGLPQASLTPSLAWLGTVCYSFQILFDFSGYSDMAIGMAEFLGFHFPENFDDPYRSKSITEFWRRWHMTLSRWFRDFLYIPLGGNRHGPLRTYLNLFTVFFLCGLWHGASWNFVVWGAFHGLLLTGERVLKNRFGFEPSGTVGNVVTFLLVCVGWVFFRAPDVTAAWGHLQVMFGLAKTSTPELFPLAHYLTNSAVFYLFVSVVLCWAPREGFRELAVWTRPAGVWLVGITSLALIFYSATVLSTVAFNPFIYFRF